MPILLLKGVNDEDVVLRFVGTIDAAAEFPLMRPRLSTRIVVDFEKLERFDEQALVHWTDWLRTFDSRQQFVLRSVPPRLIDIFNRIAGSLPSDCIFESFLIPYECESCGAEENWPVHRGRDFIEAQEGRAEKIHFPTELNCQKCKGVMKFSSWEGKYLKFLKENL